MNAPGVVLTKEKTLRKTNTKKENTGTTPVHPNAPSGDGTKRTDSESTPRKAVKTGTIGLIKKTKKKLENR